MAEWLTDTLPPFGLAFTDRTLRVINRAGGLRTRGSLMQLDIKRAAPETLNSKQGDRASCWVNVVDPNFEAATTKGGQSYAPFVLLLEDAADDAEPLALLWGITMGRVDSGGVATNGLPLALNADLSNEMSSTVAAASKVLARALGTRVGAGLVPVLFNGLHGWGKG